MRGSRNNSTTIPERDVRESIWTLTFVLNVTTSFIFYLVFYILTVSISTYVIYSLHKSTGVAGALSSIFVVGALFGRLWTGNVITKMGMKKLLYVGATVFLLFTFGYFFTKNIPLLFIIRFIEGAGFGIGSTASGTIAGHIVPKSRRGEGIGYYALSVTLAAAVGPFLSIFIYTALGGFNSLLVWSLVLLVITFIIVFFIKVLELTPEERSHALQNRPKGISRFIEVSALPISFIAFLAGFIDSGILTFMSAYSTDLHASMAGSLFFTFYAILIFASRSFVGKLFDRKGDNWVFHPIFFFFALAMFLVALATHSNAYLVLIIAGAAFGLGYGGVAPFGQAVAIRDSVKHRIGIATSTFFGFLDFGVGFGPFVLGMVVPMLGHGVDGFRHMYLYSVPAVLVVWVVYVLIHGRFQKTRQPRQR